MEQLLRDIPQQKLPVEFSLATGDKIIQVSLGGYHSAALTSVADSSPGDVIMIGQLGDGTTTERYTPTEITSRI